MSHRWSPEEDTENAGWAQPSYPPQSPRYDDSRNGYGAPGPYSTGRSSGRSGGGGWPAQQGGSWSEWGEPPGQGYYQPGRPNPHMPQYPDAPYGPHDPYEYEPPQRRRSRGLLRAAILLLVAVVVVGGGAYALITYGPRLGTHPTTASGTPGVPAGFHLYSNTAIGVRFAVPDGWTTNDNIAVAGGHGMEAASSDGNAALVAGSVPSKGNLAGGLNGAFTGMAGSKGTISNKHGPTNVTVSGTTWMQESGDIARDGAHLHAVVFDTTHGSNIYVLAFVATASSFNDANSHYFQVTLKSFQFLS